MACQKHERILSGPTDIVVEIGMPPVASKTNAVRHGPSAFTQGLTVPLVVTNKHAGYSAYSSMATASQLYVFSGLPVLVS